MALKDLVPQPITIPVGVQSLTLHPLTLTDLANISRKHLPELTLLMEGGAVASDMVALLEKSPQFVAMLIAYASKEPDDIESAGNLAFATQLAALRAIWEASMVDEESLGKLLIAVVAGIGRLNTLLKESGEKFSTQIPFPLNPGT